MNFCLNNNNLMNQSNSNQSQKTADDEGKRLELVYSRFLFAVEELSNRQKSFNPSNIPPCFIDCFKNVAQIGILVQDNIIELEDETVTDHHDLAQVASTGKNECYFK